MEGFSMNGKNVYVVSRGSLCVCLDRKWVDIRAIAERGNLREFQDFVASLKDSGNYGGVTFSNSFQVDSPIGLIGLGFFGPSKNYKATYNISIDIEEMHSNKPVYRNFENGVMGYKDKLFWVYFKTPVNIQPGIFYTVRFQLNGPDTGICDPGKLKTMCTQFDSGVKFEFLRGSNQMPAMAYILN